jgi:hypothetical protein
MPDPIINSVQEFVACLDILISENIGKKFIFRGQSDSSWDLVPAVQRQLQKEVLEIQLNQSYSDNKKINLKESLREELYLNEKKMLEEFKKEAVPFLGKFDRNSNDLEWLALAQHHYLPTRLLDWTYHAATALYFAVEGVVLSNVSEKGNEKYCAIWVAHFDDNYSVEIIQSSKSKQWKEVKPKTEPFHLDRGGKGAVLFYDPPHITPRLAAQRGCFTLHSSRYQINVVDWPTDFGVKRIKIPYTSVPGIKRSLRQLGNRGASLFPGLDGVALDIVSAHEVEKRHSDYPL